MTAPPYASAADVALDRMRWSAAVFTALVHRGRREGWLAGTAQPNDALPDPAVMRAAIDARIVASTHDAAALPMQWLAVRLDLDDRALDLLWLLAMVEMSPAITRLARAVATGPSADLTVQIAQQLIPVTRADVAALAELGLVEVSADPKLGAHQRWLRASDRVLDLARGEVALDQEIAHLGELVGPDELASRREELAPELVRALEHEVAPLIVAVGSAGGGRATLLTRTASRAGVGVLRIDARAMPRDEPTAGRMFRTIARECRLFSVLPLVTNLDDAGPTVTAAFERELITRVASAVLVTVVRERSWTVARPIVSHHVAAPTIQMRKSIWRVALPAVDAATLDDVANRYATTPGAIVAAAANAVARADATTGVTVEDVHEGLRAHFDEVLGDLAKRVTCTQTWDDIVLPIDQFEQVAELVARVRHRGQVLEAWGFGDKIGRGVGVAALFSGPPGTGKTMIAGLIARELGLDLYQVDLSRIVSKYIGETEQNLAKVFDAAESGHAVLLFDEADALFAKRSEVKSSNDRYANLEVNYLLQRIEQFRGICLLTTNHETSIDEAFRRRLAIHVRFPVPDEAHRDALWKAIIPERAEVVALDFARLAREFAMTGGYIRNAALRAAYLAAEARSPITTELLWRAARSEYEAMGKLAFGGE